MIVDPTKQRLIDAAGPIFAESGFRAATVREICDRAHVNGAAIHYHFGDKEALYIESVRHAARTCFQREPMPEWSPTDAPEKQLFEFIRTFLLRVAVDHEPRWHGDLLMREMVLPTRACRDFVHEMVRPMQQALLLILNRLLPEMGEPELWPVAMSIVGQCLHYRFGKAVVIELIGTSPVESLGIDAIAQHVTQFSLAGIADYARQHQVDPIKAPST